MKINLLCNVMDFTAGILADYLNNLARKMKPIRCEFCGRILDHSGIFCDVDCESKYFKKPPQIIKLELKNTEDCEE